MNGPNAAHSVSRSVAISIATNMVVGAVYDEAVYETAAAAQATALFAALGSPIGSPATAHPGGNPAMPCRARGKISTSGYSLPTLKKCWLLDEQHNTGAHIRSLSRVVRTIYETIASRALKLVTTEWPHPSITSTGPHYRQGYVPTPFQSIHAQTTYNPTRTHTRQHNPEAIGIYIMAQV